MKKFTSVLVTILIVLLLATAANSAPTKTFNFVKFNGENENRFGVTYDANENVSSISANDPGLFSVRATKSKFSAKKTALDFLTKNAGLFNISNAGELKVVSETKSENITHVLFAHYLNEKIVLESEISVHINNAGQVVMVNNSVIPLSVNRSIAPSSLSAVQALDIAKKHVNCVSERAKPVVSEVISAKTKVAVNAYKVEIPSKNPLGDFVCIINADNGTVIDSMDIMNHAKPSASVEKTKNGSVYVTNPLKCKITKEELLNLNAGSKGLAGKWAEIINEDSEPAAADASGNYIFEADNTHFDEVNAYYHTNKIHDFFKNFGFTGLDRAMEVTVHYGDNYDNAFFSPMSGSISLGDGKQLNDLSKEESVIYHEYTHAVTNAMVQMPYKAESGAMNEGFSDYFACTVTDDPEVGEWAMAKLNRPYIRTLVNKTHYPEDIQNEVHADSNIYGGALWDLRKELGQSTSDKLIHFSRNYLKGKSNPKFTDGINALISADKEYFRGINASKIKAVFEARGIKLQSSPTASELKAQLKYEAMKGNKDSEQLLSDIESNDGE
ncbi:MAG TPA: M36 family metallopeptidase [Candidatus Wallbacteria bacterium]|nr:M36 family metallopeptidase [Candidatus Wallbacteria bacterium]